jgi:hypothetical protein
MHPGMYLANVIVCTCQYTDLAGGCDYLEELEYDCDYILKHRINNIIDNQLLAYFSGMT